MFECAGEQGSNKEINFCKLLVFSEVTVATLENSLTENNGRHGAER